MEVVEWHKVSLQQPHQETQVHPVTEVVLQIHDVQVDLVELLVDERDERLREDTTLTLIKQHSLTLSLLAICYLSKA